MENIRNLLISYAYNILGSYEDAKDIVQDTYLKLSGMDLDAIENKKAYFIRTVINLSINFKKKQKRLAGNYPGEWLPEPVATERADMAISRKEILSYSLMALLEKLNAKQRAVFILKEAFDYEHKEIAEVLAISEENSRKIYSRAKHDLKEPKKTDSSAIPPGYLEKYMEVIYSADTRKLEGLLQDDIVIISDGGGKASAALKPVVGSTDVTKFILGLHKKFYQGAGVRIEKSTINHHPALLYFHKNVLITCQIFEFENGKVSRFYFIRNPDKLQSI